MPFLLLLVVVLVITGTGGQDFLHWCPNVRNDLIQCSNALPNVPGFGHVINNPGAVMNLQILTSDSMSDMCKEPTLTSMKNFYDCFYGKFLTCLPEDWKKAFGSVDNVKSALNYMCQNIDDIDVSCMSSKVSAMSACLTQGSSGKTPDVSNVDGYLDFVCGMFPKYLSCAQTTYGSCSGKTAEIVTKGNELGKPMGCNASISSPSITHPLNLLASLIISLFAKGKLF